MNTSQTMEIWKSFLNEQCAKKEKKLTEEEPFQKAVKKGYLKKRDQYTTTGPQKTGGAPFDKEPKRSRSQSSPPAGYPVAEDNELEEGFKDFMKRVFSTEKTKDDAAGREEPMPDLDIDQVNIPIPYPEDQKNNILKDPQVRKLLNAYISTLGLNHTGNMVAQTLVKYPSQVDNILQDFIKTARVVNVAQKTETPPENGEAEDSEPAPKQDGAKKRLQSLIKSIGAENFKNAFDKTLDDLLDELAEKEAPGGFLGAGDIANKRFKDKYKDSLSLISKEINKALNGVLKTLQENNHISLSKPTIVFIDRVYKNVIKESLSINNVSGADLTELIQNINKFYPYAQEYLKFDRPASLNLISDPNNAKDAFGKTAYYNPNNDEITIFVDKRHPKDMIRSFSHELVHHAQNCRGEFDKGFVAGENYIEHNDHLNLMEREAYEKGNMCLRYYESYLKKENNKMSLNEETLRKAIREAIKRVTETKTTVAEEATTITATMTEDSGEEEAWHQWKNEHADDDHIKEIEHHLRALRGDRDHERDEAEYDHDKYEDEGMEEGLKDTGLTGADGDDDKKTYDDHFKEDAVDEDKAYTAKKEEPGADKRKGAEKRGAEGTLAKTKGHGKVDYVNEEEATTPLHEKINREKGQLVFDRLVKKWCK